MYDLWRGQDLIRYIHLNPVRAKLVTQAHEYYWSSHRAYLGCITYPWLTCDFVLNQFGNNKATALEQYKIFMQGPLHNNPQIQFQTGNHKGFSILADNEFINKINSASSYIKYNLDLKNIINFVCDYQSIDEINLHTRLRTHFYAEIRAKIAWIAQDLKICPLTTVAKYFDRDLSGLTRTLKRIIKNKDSVQALRKLSDQIKKSTSHT